MHRKVINRRTSPVIAKYSFTVQFLELKYVIRFAAESFTAANFLIQKRLCSQEVGK